MTCLTSDVNWLHPFTTSNTSPLVHNPMHILPFLLLSDSDKSIPWAPSFWHVHMYLKVLTRILVQGNGSGLNKTDRIPSFFPPAVHMWVIQGLHWEARAPSTLLLCHLHDKASYSGTGICSELTGTRTCSHWRWQPVEEVEGNVPSL